MSDSQSTRAPAVKPAAPEPWLRGTKTEIPAVPRAVLHALELAQEDLEKWCAPLTDQQLNARPAGLAPVAFHLRHIARSIDRLLTYAEGQGLTQDQLAHVKTEMEPDSTRQSLFAELSSAMTTSAARIQALASANLDQARAVGRQALPTTLGGLLVHVADHTLRHVGQAITTAKIVASYDE